MNIKSLTIFCSSSEKLTSDYYNLSNELGIYLANKSIKIIYGGGKTGMMGKISKSSYSSGGKVVGIIPKFLATKATISTNITKTIVVNDMSERKKKLFQMGDGFLILPGGPGTIEEASEIISWKLLGIHSKEIIIFNFNKYWDPFIKMYDNSINKKFGNKNLQNITKHVRTIKEFIKLFS